MNVPVGEIPAALRPASKEERQSPEAANSAVERARVLVVDDDDRNLLAVSTVLDDLGEVVQARSGEEALRHLLKGEFAVILLDVYMPGMDGYETAQIIRSRDQSKGIPIVFLSAVNKEAEHLLRGYAMGAVDYVFKPVDPVILRSKVAVFVELFEKSKEVEHKARQERVLLDANLRANAELLRAEQDLRRAEQRQAAIIQSLPMVLYLEPFDRNPRYPSYVSGDLKAITGFSEQDIADNPGIWADRLHPEDRDRVVAAIEARQRSGRLAVEYRWQTADGTYRHLMDQAVLLRDADGGPIEFAGTLTDITEQRSLESQLMHVQKMDAIGKLTGGIAHDFNNLLAAVIGGLSVIERRTELAPEQQKLLDMTKRAAEQGSDLVRRLLAFARKQQLQPQAIDLMTLRDAVVELLQHTLGGLVKFDWQIEDKAWRVFADQAQLELALMNLIINARDAMPSGGTVSISADNRHVKAGDFAGLEAGDYVRLAVQDTGTGIAPEHLEKVLEPFFTTKEVGKGSGLGLSMVYGFAKQSNGAFRLDSEEGEGTSAELWLPRAPEHAVGLAAPQSEAGDRTASRKLRVLLVDDHHEVRSTTAAILSDFGHSVIEAASANEALDLMKAGDCAFELMITDYAMPNVSGAEFLREARLLCPNVAALIITGYADAAAIQDRPEGVEVLLKPFTQGKLEDAIQRVTEATIPAA
jgi:PAS domain S-box-containing protein